MENGRPPPSHGGPPAAPRGGGVSVPARDGHSAGSSPLPLGMRSSRVAGAGVRAAPRPSDRRYSPPARDGRRDLPGAGWRERGFVAPEQAVERVAPDGLGTALLGVALRAIWGRPGAPWLVAGAVALFLGGELLQLISGHVVGPWRDLWVIGAAGGAATASAWVALRSGRLLDSLWGWVAAGCAVWAVGALARAAQPSAVRSGSDPLLLADLGFLGLTPLFLAGIALAFPSGPTTLPRVRLIIDAVVLPAALGLLAYLLIGREGGAQPAADLHVLLAVAYPVASLSLALGAILGYRRVEAAGAGRAALGAGRAGGGRRMGPPGGSALPSGYLVWATLAFVPGAGLLAWATLA